MRAAALHILLDDLADSRELVLPPGGAGDDPALAAWRSAARAARDAYAAWCAAPGPLTHAAYLAGADQADAAAASLEEDRLAGAPHAQRRLAA